VVGIGDRIRALSARYHWVAAPVAAVFLIAGAVRLIVWLPLQKPVDWEIYRDAALRWQAGEGYFLPYQLSGPYVPGAGEPLYPPVILWLLVPFTHLPPILWWAVPIGALAAVIVWWQPRGWGLVGMAICLALVPTQSVYLTGRPTMWISTFFALGLARGGWAVLVFLKPSVFPAALVGIRRRWWWITLAIYLGLCATFGLAMWIDWVHAVLNSGGGLLYSIQDSIVLGVPLMAWLGRSRHTEKVEYPSEGLAAGLS